MQMRRLKTLSAHSIHSQRPKFSSQSLCFHALSEYLNDFILHRIKVVSINVGICLLSAIKYNIPIFFKKMILQQLYEQYMCESNDLAN